MNAATSTTATIMHFVICLPDWNSIDSVRRAHNDLEGAALVFFALLVVCEALAHLSDEKKTERLFDKIGIVFFALAVLSEIAAFPYGHRNDTLSGQAIVSLDAKARDASANASTALSNSKEAETKSSDAVDKSGKAQLRAGAAYQETVLLKSENDKLANRVEEESAQLNAITPRSVLIRRASKDIIKLISRPSVTLFALRVCNEAGQEAQEAEKALEQILYDSGWRKFRRDTNRDDCTPATIVGIHVFSSDDPQKTLEAAQSLSGALTSLLPPQSGDVLKLCTSYCRSVRTSNFPWSVIVERPDVIAILVGAIPLAGTQTAQQSKTPKTKPH